MLRICRCRPKLAYVSAGLCICSHTAYVEKTSRGQPRYDLQIRFLSLFTHPRLKTEVENGPYTACITWFALTLYSNQSHAEQIATQSGQRGRCGKPETQTRVTGMRRTQSCTTFARLLCSHSIQILGSGVRSQDKTWPDRSSIMPCLRSVITLSCGRDYVSVASIVADEIS